MTNHKNNFRSETTFLGNPNLLNILLHQQFYVIVDLTSKYFLSTVFLKKNLWAKHFLLLKLQLPTELPYIIDGAQFNSSKSLWTIQFNCNNILTDTRLNVFTHLDKNQFFLKSLSSIFKSTVWLERELSDFTNINFLGLLDTRRLLIDYFDDRKIFETHISNDKNYNNNLYDIFLNF